MTKKMPTGNFKWVEKTLEEILDTSNESNEGYFVMVGLLCPQNLHDSHNDFPLASEKMTIDKESLSSYQQDLNLNPEQTKKLVEILFDKKNYVCHYSMLKFLVQQRLKVKNIRKILQFDQSNFMAVYINLITKMRQRPQNTDFDKQFFKLLNNSCFDKTMGEFETKEKVDNRKR